VGIKSTTFTLANKLSEVHCFYTNKLA